MRQLQQQAVGQPGEAAGLWPRAAPLTAPATHADPPDAPRNPPLPAGWPEARRCGSGGNGSGSSSAATR